MSGKHQSDAVRKLTALMPAIWEHFSLSPNERVYTWNAAMASQQRALRCYQAMARTIPLRSVHERIGMNSLPNKDRP